MADLKPNPCPGAQCSEHHRTRVADHEALAFLTGAAFVEQVWLRVMGAPLTLSHGFSRNPEQQKILHHLTEEVFLASRWSLRELLIHILDSRYFNRQPPAEQVVWWLAPYEMPPVFDPWWALPPGDPNTTNETTYNAMTESIARHRPTTLVRASSTALGWPTHRAFPDDDYPALSLYRNIGQFLSEGAPGFNEVGLGGMLAWEKTVNCIDKPMTDDDWIDRLMDDAQTMTTPGGSLAVLDLFVALRRRMLGDGTIDQPEEEALLEVLKKHVALPGLDVPTYALTQANWANVEKGLRDACGVMLQSPQFMLAGLHSGADDDAPVIDTCMPGEPCALFTVCQDYQAGFNTVLAPLSLYCYPEDFDVFSRGPGGGDPVSLPDPYTGNGDQICPRGQCGFIRLARTPDGLCADDPSACGGAIEPPPCDPRCVDTRSCCDDPAPALPLDGVHVIWANGSTVTDASGVRISTGAAEPFTPLTEGRVLAYGDLIEVPADAGLNIEPPPDLVEAAANGGPAALPFAYTPPLPDVEGIKPRYLLVTGQPALDQLTALASEKSRVIELRAQNAAYRKLAVELDPTRPYGILHEAPADEPVYLETHAEQVAADHYTP